MSNNNSDQYQEYHFEVPDNETSDTRLDKYLATKIEDTSRTKIQEAIKDGLVKVNEKKEKASYPVESGDVLHIRIPTPQPPEVTPEKMPLDIAYEDDDLLLVNKSANMVVHPATGNWSGTLVNGLMWYTDDLSEPEEDTIRPGRYCASAG